MTARDMGIVWKGKTDGKSTVTSGLFPFDSTSVPQSFSSVCFNVCLHAGTALELTLQNAALPLKDASCDLLFWFRCDSICC